MAPDERRRAIIEAVVPLLLERGGDLTTREIADAAGIAEGTIFRVFEDKSELLHEACWHIMRPEGVRAWLDPIDEGAGLEATIRQTVGILADGVERMTRVMITLRSLALSKRGDLVVVQHPGRGKHPPQEFFAESNRIQIEILAEKLRPYADQLAVSTQTAATVVRGLVLGSHSPLPAGKLPRPTVEEMVAILVAGLTRADAGFDKLNRRQTQSTRRTGTR